MLWSHGCLAEGDGTKVYASCLSFYDRVPHVLCTKHEHLLGAVALKAICLLSHQPYLATADKASTGQKAEDCSACSSRAARAGQGHKCSACKQQVAMQYSTMWLCCLLPLL